MRRNVLAFASGLVFAIGLALAGMTQPAKVVGFLDFLGDWDPSLAFVMMGAILVFFPAYRVATRRPAPVWAERFHIPEPTAIDARLLGGAALFGVGWGLGGFCPGPALSSLGALSTQALVFTAGMLGGFLLHRLLPSALPPPVQHAER